MQKTGDQSEKEADKKLDSINCAQIQVSADNGTVDAATIRRAEEANKDRIKGSATQFLALRDDESLDRLQVRTLQHKQAEMGLVDEEKGIIHTAKGMAPLIKDDCPFEVAKLLSQIRAKDENELRQKLDFVYSSLAVAGPSPKGVPEVSKETLTARTDAQNLTPAQKHFEDVRKVFWHENGVDMAIDPNNKIVYWQRGHEKPLYVSDNTHKGMEDAHREIEKIRAAKQQELTKVYGATFTQNGETAGSQNVYDAQRNCWVSGAETIKCRAPSLGELSGIEAALAVTQPSAKNIKFFIMENQLYKNLTEGADYHLVPPGCSDKSTKPGAPAIFINGEVWRNVPPTEAVAEFWQKNFDWRNNSIEDAVVHELGHHSQKVLGWNEHLKGSAKTNGVVLAEQMGWQSPSPFTQDTRRYLIEDKNGGLWKHEILTGKVFVRTAKNGSLLDSHGNVVSDPMNAQKITNEQMQQTAKVTPFSSYNDAPDEMYAEALTAFRDGDRRELLNKSPGLYKVIKDADQKEINRVHPPDRPGHPSFVRDFNGKLVANTTAVEEQLRKLEK
ncbi:MAG: hypothetical protein IAF58_01255 [Leptolyngbya sp.]|nr:hypothetical protein [Candidatus Melainabacteria bacterium]